MPEHREESVVSVKNSDANPGKRHIADLATSRQPIASEAADLALQSLVDLGPQMSKRVDRGAVLPFLHRSATDASDFSVSHDT
jgi:hypothetical protein